MRVFFFLFWLTIVSSLSKIKTDDCVISPTFIKKNECLDNPVLGQPVCLNDTWRSWDDLNEEILEKVVIN